MTDTHRWLPRYTTTAITTDPLETMLAQREAQELAAREAIAAPNDPPSTITDEAINELLALIFAPPAEPTRDPNGLVSDYPTEANGTVTHCALADEYQARLELERRQEITAKNRIRASPIRGESKNISFTRAQIIHRDQRTCHLCGKRGLTNREIHLDHVHPISKGGTHTYDNVKVSCAPCNLSKGARIL